VGDKKRQNALTERFIETVKTPGYYGDALLPAFGIRIGKTRKTFVVTRGKLRERIRVGLWPAVSLQEARKRAKALLATNPRTVPASAFLEARDDFLKLHVSRLKSHAAMERVMNKHCTWAKSLHLVTRHDVQSLLDELHETPSEANHTFKYLRTFFFWCVRRGLLEHSPLTAMRMPYKETPRDRVLTDDELRAVWNASGDDIFGRTVKLLILTGCRKSEIQNLIVNGDTATLPAAHSKNGREHTFPLPATALPLLSSGALTFNGWSKAKARLDRAVPIDPWTLHDLRRTYATTHARIGTPIHITERLLNHVSGSFGGIVSTYQRYTHQPEMRLAVEAYEAHILRLVNSQKS
jgi:integrase